MYIEKFSEPPMNASCYVCIGEGNSVVIDPCVKPETVFKRLCHCIRVTHILITHGHFDHISCLDEWKKATGADVIISYEDACMLTSPVMNASSIFGLPRLECKSRPDLLLYGGEHLTLGSVEFDVEASPGHTAGSLLFLSEKYLFSGDTLFFGNYGRYDLYSGDPEALRETLSGMKKYSNKGLTLCPGHGDMCDFDSAYDAL